MRTFISLELPEEIKQEAARMAAALKQSGANVKWVRPAGMHLTLKFLGEVDPGLLPKLRQALDAACHGKRALNLRLSGCGSFPPKGRPSVVWLGLAGEVAELAALAGDIETSMEALGFARESRPFRAHLTLGRVRRGKGGGPLPQTGELKRRIAGLMDWHGPDFAAGRVVLYKSILAPAGAIYEPLHQIKLV